jgi:hypothetical protein
MGKHKLDPRIIRIDDRIKIINPQVFVRCGYPLCKQNLIPELNKAYGKIVQNLIDSVKMGDTMMESDKDGKYPNKQYCQIEQPVNSHYLVIMNELASIRLIEKNFGGKDRKIYTETVESLRNAECSVWGVRFVKTGIYVLGSGKYRGFCDDNDCYPFLDHIVSHKILKLSLCLKNNYLPVEIEACHVEKIPDDRDYVQDKEGHWIQNPSYCHLSKN